MTSASDYIISEEGDRWVVTVTPAAAWDFPYVLSRHGSYEEARAAAEAHKQKPEPQERRGFRKR